MHEKIVDEKFNFSAVKMSEETNERNSVKGSQRVIRFKNETTFGRDIFFPYHIDMHVHIRKQIVGEFYTGTVFIELIYLPDEMFNSKNKTFDIYIGKPIPWQTFDKSKSLQEWAQIVKEKVYQIKKNQ